MSEELKAGYQLPNESIAALRQLLLNAVDAIDDDLVLDVLEAGAICYAIKAVVVASCFEEDDFDMIETQFEEAQLLGFEEDSARDLMTKLFGVRWSPRIGGVRWSPLSAACSDLTETLVSDGKPFIRRVGNRVKR